MSDLVLASEYAATELGLPDGLTFEEWEGVGRTLARIGQAHQWWVGDWLNYGERAYGEKYSQAMDATGLDYSAVANFAWVSKMVKRSTRVESLSWSHHREVAKLSADDQASWLARATEHKWGVVELSEAIKADAGEPKKVRCPTCGSVVKADKLTGREESR